MYFFDLVYTAMVEKARAELVGKTVSFISTDNIGRTIVCQDVDIRHDSAMDQYWLAFTDTEGNVYHCRDGKGGMDIYFAVTEDGTPF